MGEGVWAAQQHHVILLLAKRGHAQFVTLTCSIAQASTTHFTPERHAAYKNTNCTQQARQSQANQLLLEGLPAFVKHGILGLDFKFDHFSTTWESQGEFRVANSPHGLQTRVDKYSP